MISSVNGTIAFSSNNPFDDEKELQVSSYVHIRIRQRTGKTHITSVEGLSSDLDLKKLCRAFQKEFNCGGNVTVNKDNQVIIQLTGDQRQNVKSFLIREDIVPKNKIVIHGY